MTLENFVTSCKLWLRLAMFILGPIRSALLNVLHNNGVPKQPKDLYSFLVSKRTIFARLKGKGIITQPQWNLLYPPGNETDCNLFDITLIVLLIEALTPIVPNDGDWRNDKPPDTDTSVGSFCIRGKNMRNHLNHFADITALNGSEFSLKWGELLQILHGLNYNSLFNVNDLKTVSLDLQDNLLLRSIILANQIKLSDHDKEINKLRNDNDIELNELRNSNVMLENRITSNVTTLREHLEDMQFKLWSNSFESEDLLRDIEETHKSIMEMQNDIASLKNDFKGLSNRMENLEGLNLPKRMDILEEGVCKLTVMQEQHEAQDLNYNKFSTVTALNIVSQMIGKDWNRLSSSLNIKNTFKEPTPDEDKMKQCFEQANNKIYWKSLKYELQQIQRRDIIDEVISKTCCTHGLEEYSKSMKKRYKRDLTQWNIPSAFKSNFGKKCMTKDRNGAYVDLMVGTWGETFGSNHEHFLKSHSKAKERIEVKDIIQENDRSVLIRGIAGIGKTSLIDNFVLQWADEKIIEDFDFVFKFACRELNTLNDISSWEELIRRHFPDVYDELFDDLIESSSRVLIIIDGIDEFKYLDDIKKIAAGRPAHKFASVIHNIILQRILPNSKVIVCGRPQACDTIKNILRPSQVPKLIEVSGFNESSIDVYIEFFFGGNKEKIQSLRTSLNEVQNVKAMAHIPVYLYIICNVYASEEKLKELNTTTKLNIASCLIFLRDHMTEFKGSNCSLHDLAKNERVSQMIIQISKFAFKSLQERKIYFTQNEFSVETHDCLAAIEQSGIIEKVEGNDDGDFYQFKHLVLQEFLCAVHIFHESLDVRKCISEFKNMYNCLPLVAGLHGILGENYCGPNYIKQLVQGIKGSEAVELVESLFNTEYPELFLAAFYEYHTDVNNVNDFIQNYFFDSSMLSPVFTTDVKQLLISYHHTLNHLMFFLKRVTNVIPKKLSVSIEMKDKKLLHNEFLELLTLLSSECFLIKYLCFQSMTLNAIDFMLTHALDLPEKERMMLAWKSPTSIAHKLENLSFSECVLTDYHVMLLQPYIPFLRVLNLKKVNLTSLSIKYISQAITRAVEKDANTLEGLILENCNLTDEHIKQLQPCIPYLEWFHLCNESDMTSFSMKYISEIIIRAIEKNTYKFETLYLTQCELTDAHIQQLQPCIPHIKSLDLSFNFNMTSLSMKYISESVIQSKKLELLILSYCDLTDKHIQQLKPCIPNLHFLDLSINRNMTSLSTKYISESITQPFKKNVNKLELRLACCNFRDVHIKQLQPCIPHLKDLDLSTNKGMTPISMKYISESIIQAVNENTNTLAELDIRSCDLSDNHIQQLKPCIPHLQGLDLSYNKDMTSFSMKYIAESITQAVAENTSKLKKLKLSAGLCDLSYFYIDQLLKSAPSLQISYHDLPRLH